MGQTRDSVVQFGIGIGKTFPKMASRFFVFICVATLQCLLAGKVSAFDCSTDGIFPDDSNCAKFIICNGNNTYRLDCPAGLVFNPTALTCDWPEHVPECDVNPTVASIQSKKTDCSSDGTFSAEDDCTKFVVCFSGFAETFTCPASTIFNPSSLLCDWN